jgi:hypothetical protein
MGKKSQLRELGSLAKRNDAIERNEEFSEKEGELLSRSRRHKS